MFACKELHFDLKFRISYGNFVPYISKIQLIFVQSTILSSKLLLCCNKENLLLHTTHKCE